MKQPNHRRLKLTLILLMLLFAGKYVKADIPCYQAIQMQHDSIDSLQYKLAAAQSLPYNIGYQEGYKQGKNAADNAIPLPIKIIVYAFMIGIIIAMVAAVIKFIRLVNKTNDLSDSII